MTYENIYAELEKIGSEMRGQRQKLRSELSRVDKEITDIEHYLEFYALSASQGYKIAKMLKDRFVRRREIKNDLETIDRISVMSVGHIANGKGRSDLSKMSDRHYSPRVLVELFAEHETKEALSNE